MFRTARIPPPIHIHHIQIQILLPASPPSSKTSYILPSTPPHHHRPTTNTNTNTTTTLLQPPLRLDDIKLKPDLSPEQILLHSQTPLTPTHQHTLSSYLQSTISFPSLRRLATHLSAALATTPPPDQRIQRSLEQRAHLVADATILRAQAPTPPPHSQSPPSPSTPPPFNKNKNTTTTTTTTTVTPSPSYLRHLNTQHLALVHALAHLDQRILSYTTSDPQAAESLIPVRAQMRATLSQVSALLIAYGQSLSSSSQSCAQRCAAKARASAVHFVPQTPDYVLLHSESDTDESDLAAAVRLPSHHFRDHLSRGRDYDSADSDIAYARPIACDGAGCSDDDDDGDDDDDNGGDGDSDDDHDDHDNAVPSVATALQANFVIDLDASSSAPSWGVFGGRVLNKRVATKRAAMMHQQMIMRPGERYGAFSPFGARHVQKMRPLIEEDGYSGDLDDLERSAERRRNRIRHYGRVGAAVNQ